MSLGRAVSPRPLPVALVTVSSNDNINTMRVRQADFPALTHCSMLAAESRQAGVHGVRGVRIWRLKGQARAAA